RDVPGRRDAVALISSTRALQRRTCSLFGCFLKSVIHGLVKRHGATLAESRLEFGWANGPSHSHRRLRGNREFDFSSWGRDIWLECCGRAEKACCALGLPVLQGGQSQQLEHFRGAFTRAELGV